MFRDFPTFFKLLFTRLFLIRVHRRLVTSPHTSSTHTALSEHGLYICIFEKKNTHQHLQIRWKSSDTHLRASMEDQSANRSEAEVEPTAERSERRHPDRDRRPCSVSHGALIRWWVMLMAGSCFVSALHPPSPSSRWCLSHEGRFSVETANHPNLQIKANTVIWKCWARTW